MSCIPLVYSHFLLQITSGMPSLSGGKLRESPCICMYVCNAADGRLTDDDEVVNLSHRLRSTRQKHFLFLGLISDHLCGVVVRVLGHRSRGLGSTRGLPDFLISGRSVKGPTRSRDNN
jgi:hypothetical protein